MVEDLYGFRKYKVVFNIEIGMDFDIVLKIRNVIFKKLYIFIKLFFFQENGYVYIILKDFL